MTFQNNIINNSSTIKMALTQMSKVGEKCLLVVDKNKNFLGTISDGDIRKSILKNFNINNLILNIFNRNSIILKENYNYQDAKEIFLKKKLDLLPVVDKNNKIVDVLFWNKFFNEKIKYKSNIPVVIMAGGKGTRLSPFTEILPKPLIPINGKSVIEIIIEKFENLGFNNFFVTVNYKSKILKAYLSEYKKKKKIKFINEKIPLGTAGSLSYFYKKNFKNIFVINCDTIMDLNFKNLLKYHEDSNNDITLVGSQMTYVFPYGICKFTKNMFLKKIEEKKTYNYFVNTGLYIIKTENLNIQKNKLLDMNTLILQMIKNKKIISVYPIENKFWHDVGQWKELYRTNKDF